MENQIAVTDRIITPEMESAIKQGNAVIVHLKPTSTGKYQAEFQQMVEQQASTPEQMALALGLGIKRSPQSAWLTVSKDNISQFILGSTGPAPEGYKFGVQISEYQIGDKTRDGSDFSPWELQDGRSQEPKIDPSTGEFLLHNGHPIYRQSDVVIIPVDSKVNHRFLATTSRVSDLDDLNEIPMG